MSGHRPFDDGRFPDAEMFADCFLCGKRVDPLDRHRGTYDEPPAGPDLPIHLPCLDGRSMLSVGLLYHKALVQMSDFSMKAMR